MLEERTSPQLAKSDYFLRAFFGGKKRLAFDKRCEARHSASKENYLDEAPG